MATDVAVPTLGESVAEATVSKWFKKAGEAVSADEPLVELETDKVTIEVPAPVGGALSSISVEEGAEVEVGASLCVIDEGADGAAAAPPAPAAEPAPAAAAPAPEPAPAPAPAAAAATNDTLSPAVQKLISDNKLDPAAIPATGPKGQLTKGDVVAFLESGGAAPAPAAPAPAPAAAPKPVTTPPPVQSFEAKGERPLDPRGEERVRMSKLRRVIASRLKEAQNTAAMLTTFNEVNMDALIALRAEYKDRFEKRHSVKLGFMSFFVKAAIAALKELPSVNGEIFGDEIIYKNYYDIGIAVGTPQGLVVPVLRDADRMDFAEIESTIADFGRRARDGKLTMAEMTGGTFTITNGGIFGSMLSTPILNPPQSGILGMHAIKKRPIVDGDQVTVGSIMYLAHSYDHRIIDGREAVTFLIRIKEMIEEPARLLIDV